MTTTANLEPVITYIADHLAAQRRPSTVPRGSRQTCAYRGTDRTKCAVGALFSDEAYEKAGEPEDMDVFSLLDTYKGDPIRDEAMAWKPEGMKDFDFIHVLSRSQNYHDGSDLVSVHYETTLANHGHLSDEELAAQIAEDLRKVMGS